MSCDHPLGHPKDRIRALDDWKVHGDCYNYCLDCGKHLSEADMRAIFPSDYKPSYGDRKLQ